MQTQTLLKKVEGGEGEEFPFSLDSAVLGQDEVDAERRREKERAQSQWAKFGPPGVYGRYEGGSFRTDTDEQRNAYNKTMAFPWADQEADGAKFASLALLGTPGTGKTHLAALWLRQQVFADGFEGQFITAAQLVREVRRAWDDRSVDETKVLERFGTIDSLVIDDIGVDISEGVIRILMEVLDMRLANDLTTCYTGCASPTQLKEIFGPRGFSRLMAKARIVVLTGADQRMA
ncbi:MAG: replication protein DnaC [Polaromonas sp.]|nr:replication protein DnaC [Polaromonas sp.]